MPYKEFKENKTPRHVLTLDNFGFDILPKINRKTIKQAREIQKEMRVCYFCGMILNSDLAHEVENNKFSCQECFSHLKE